MKKSKAIYTKAFREYKFSDDQLKLLHDTLFGMLLDIKKVCGKYDIKFILAGGTMLGAIRHKGFIPWDDDLDILMLRSEYEKFSKVFIKETGDIYDLVEPLEKQYTNKKPKVFLKKSIFTEVNFAGLPDQYRRVFIDIFLIEDVPASATQRKFIGNLYNFAFYAASLAADYRYPSPIILRKAKEDVEIGNYYRTRRRIGHILNIFFGMRFYIWLTTKLGHTKKETGWVAVPASFGYNREVFRKEMFQDLIQVPFNGELFYVPRNYDAYLKNLYQDYMKLPPEEDRAVHSCAEFKLLV